MDDESEAFRILRRLEPALAALSQDVAVIKATLPHLATKEDLAGVRATLPNLATKDELHRVAFGLTWRFLSLLGGLLIAYLGAIWWTVTTILAAHGVK